MEKHCLLGATPTGLSIRRIAWHSSWICHVELQLAALAIPSPNLGQVLQPSFRGNPAFFTGQSFSHPRKFDIQPQDLKSSQFSCFREILFDFPHFQTGVVLSGAPSH